MDSESNVEDKDIEETDTFIILVSDQPDKGLRAYGPFSAHELAPKTKRLQQELSDSGLEQIEMTNVPLFSDFW